MSAPCRREAEARERFRAAFGAPPDAVALAPGRVNLLGEHTDYNDGHVLPIAIVQQTAVALRRRGPPGSEAAFELHSDTYAADVAFTLDERPEPPFARYVFGCLVEARHAGVSVPPLQMLVRSDVPVGVGLSSSAALEVATLRALRQLAPPGASVLDDVRIAQLAQAAEITHAGVRCGIMDQMACSLADARHALWLDTRSLERRLVDLPRGSAVLVLDSGIARALADSGYNQRRAECEAAAQLLGVASLRDLTDPEAAAQLPAPLPQRVRHVVSENARVLRAVACDDPREFGALMNASHASLRDDYAVSVPPLDALVALLQQHPAVFGARLTGAGFGGACVALCVEGTERGVAAEVLAQYRAAGFEGRRLVPAEASG